MVLAPSASSINLPEKYATKFDRPWLKPKTRLHSSQTFAKNWRWFKNLKIQGINSTFNEVLQILEQNDCFFVGYGSGIKNILLGTIKEKSLLKIAGETTCNSFK
uniref:Uncharacterized protein n=1 Tax=Panagrolaimus sp. PS1159 TaxID=55785 RepID=A0AC35GQG6_9BILA